MFNAKWTSRKYCFSNYDSQVLHQCQVFKDISIKTICNECQKLAEESLQVIRNWLVLAKLPMQYMNLDVYVK